MILKLVNFIFENVLFNSILYIKQSIQTYFNLRLKIFKYF